MDRPARIPWRQIFLESFFVVLGVVLALAANEWRRSANERALAREAENGIIAEFETNREAVRNAAVYHLALTDSLMRYLGQTGGPRREVHPGLFSRGFVSPAPLLSTAWEAASATGAVNRMSYDRVLAYATMYQRQEEYAVQSHQVAEMLYGALFEKGIGGVVGNAQNLQSILSTFWYRECQLLGRYDGILDGIENIADREPLPPACGYVVP